MRPLFSLLGGFVCAWLLIACVIAVNSSPGYSPGRYEAPPNDFSHAPAPKVAALKAAAGVPDDAKSARLKAKSVCCECGANCQCGPECACNDLATIATKAASEGKPLLIWVDQRCACEQQLPDCIHAHVKEYRGVNGVEREPKVIVGRPDGLGGMVVATRFLGCPSDLPSQVRRVLGLRRNTATAFDGGGFTDPAFALASCGPGG